MTCEQVLLQDGDVAIIQRGRGPEIRGTRITVYDIVGYQQMGWTAERTAEWLRLTVPQVEAASRYIERHRDEVAAEYQKILDRAARGNPPEVQAKVDAAHTRFSAKLDERRRRRVEELFRDGTGGNNGHDRAGGGR